MKPIYKYIIALVAILIIILFTFKILFFRIDLTQEKRYSISKASKDILKNIKSPINIIIYMGNVDANIAYLKNAINDMLDEFSVYSRYNISYSYIDPSNAKSDKERNKTFAKFENRGMSPITISTRDNKGKVSQTIIFPWADVIFGGDTLPVCIMKPTGMKTGEESVNVAIEELEYNFIDAFKILSADSYHKIAFIEGHDELTEIETYSITESLSRYFQVDRGTLGDDASIIDDYKAIIIAKPMKPFSESDKFIIDQYIMNGGKVIWLIDAIKYSPEELSKSGISPVMNLDININDMLFRYGARIEPSIVQDLQCIHLPVNVAMVGEPPVFEQIPYRYAPLLMTSPQNPITKNLMNVKADFPSFIQQVSIENNINMEILLASSPSSRVDMAPTNIDLKNLADIEPKQFINAQFVPIGVIMQGEFQSIFKHRQAPKNLINMSPRKDKSSKNRMVIVADGDIIKNDIERSQEGRIGIIPLGIDRTTGLFYGNANFMINTVLSLTEDESLIQLRNRVLKLRMLDKQKIIDNRILLQLLNITIPVILLSIFGICYIILHKRQYR